MAADDKYVISVEAKTDDAEKKLKAVANATEQVGNASKKTAKDAQNLSGVVGQAAEAASSMGGAFGGAGRVVAIFSASLRALKMALAGATGGISLLIGAIATAVAAVVGLFQRHGEKLKAFEKEQKRIHASEMQRITELNNAKLQAIQQEFERTKTASDALLASLIQVDAANRRLLSAQEQAELSVIDADEQKALAKAVGDAQRQGEIRQDYAFRRAEVSRRYRTKTLEADLARASEESRAAGRSVAQIAEKRRSQNATIDEAEAKRQALGKSIENQKELLAWMERTGVRFTQGQKAVDAQKATLMEMQGEYDGLTESLKRMREALESTQRELTIAVDAQTAAKRGEQAVRLQLETHMTTSAEAERGMRENQLADRRVTHERAKAAEAQKAAERQRRIQEADALAAKEAEDVTRLQGEAMAHRATLDAAQGDVTRAREAYGAALRRQRGHQARFGSGYARSFTAGKDDAAVSRAAEEAAQAEAAFRQAAQAAEAFFKTFDAALRREQGEAERAAQRAKAARETN